MERSSTLRPISPNLPTSGPSVGRIGASCWERGTGQSEILRRPFPTQPKFAAERLGDGSFRFPGDPRRCLESCTSGRRNSRGLVPTQPRTGWFGSSQRIPGCCTSERRSCRGSDPIRPTLQEMIRYVATHQRSREKSIHWPWTGVWEGNGVEETVWLSVAVMVIMCFVGCDR
jgi:hypothetical protein